MSCKGCNERHYKCHSECQKYKEWKQEQEDIKNYLKEQNRDEHKQNEYAAWDERRRKETRDGRKRPKYTRWK